MEQAVYVTLGLAVLNLVGIIFQSVRENHFTSDCCCGICSVGNSYLGKDSVSPPVVPRKDDGDV